MLFVSSIFHFFTEELNVKEMHFASFYLFAIEKKVYDIYEMTIPLLNFNAQEVVK